MSLIHPGAGTLPPLCQDRAKEPSVSEPRLSSSQIIQPPESYQLNVLDLSPQSIVISYGTLNSQRYWAYQVRKQNQFCLSSIGCNVHLMCVSILERVQGIDSEYNLSPSPFAALVICCRGWSFECAIWKDKLEVYISFRAQFPHNGQTVSAQNDQSVNVHSPESKAQAVLYE